MDGLTAGLLIVIAVSGVLFVYGLWGMAQRPRKRNQARMQRQQEWADSGSWPAEWRDYYPTDWEYGEDYGRMFALGFQAESDWVDEHGGHSVIWIHRQLREAVERAASPPLPHQVRRL
jgi:hypothetical protein